MAIDKNSNGFTFGFAIGMVVVVGTILSITAMSLKPAQDENIKREKMQNILKAINVEVERDEAPGVFNEYVKERITISFDGDEIASVEGEIDKMDKTDAFNIDVKKDYKAKVKPLLGKFKGDPEGFLTAIRAEQELGFPLYVCEKDGNKYYVAPMVGTGLWGPVWGFISFEDDMNTVYGATFDHKTETPGLGAEIKYKWFGDMFIGDQILDENGDYVSIKVKKGGAAPDDLHGVDAITGGTITSNGVTEMLVRSLETYAKYFDKQRN